MSRTPIWVYFISVAACPALCITSCSIPRVEPISKAIIPIPLEVNWSEDSDQLTVWRGAWNWTIDGEWSNVARHWKSWLPGTEEDKGMSIVLSRVEGFPKEGYELDLASSGVSIRASHEAGAFHALTTLRWMLPVDSDYSDP